MDRAVKPAKKGAAGDKEPRQSVYRSARDSVFVYRCWTLLRDDWEHDSEAR